MQPEIIKFLPVGGSVMRSTQYSACTAPHLAISPGCCKYSWHLWTPTQCATINSICFDGWGWGWWGPNAKWSGAGGRGLTLYTLWSLVTGWIEVMNFKTCLYACLQINLFLYLKPIVYFHVPPQANLERYHWGLSAKFIGKFWEVFSF